MTSTTTAGILPWASPMTEASSFWRWRIPETRETRWSAGGPGIRDAPGRPSTRRRWRRIGPAPFMGQSPGFRRKGWSCSATTASPAIRRRAVQRPAFGGPRILKDEGRTWTPPETVTKTPFYEPSVTYTDGRFVGLLRNAGGTARRRYDLAVSTDLGRTWDIRPSSLAVPEGLPGMQPSPFIIADPNDPKRVYALRSIRGTHKDTLGRIDLWTADTATPSVAPPGSRQRRFRPPTNTWPTGATLG